MNRRHEVFRLTSVLNNANTTKVGLVKVRLFRPFSSNNTKTNLEPLRLIPGFIIQKEETPQPQKTYKFDSSDSYTIGEISKKYGISDSTVYKTIRKVSIPTCQKGKFVFVPKAEIDKVFNPSK